MSDVNAGTATAAYIMDIADVERKAAQLRQIFAGVRQDAAGATTLAGPTAGGASGANENAAALSRQALAAGDAAGALDLMNQALGKQTEQEQQSTHVTEASVRSQAALLVVQGRRVEAIELLEAALAKQTAGSAEAVAIETQLTRIENQGVAAADARAAAEVRAAAQAAAAAGQRAAAEERAATQAAAAATRDADATIRLAQEQARAAIAVKDYAGALEILNGVQTEGASAQTVAALETQIATTERAGTVTGAFGAEMAGLVNPLTLVVGGLALATKAAQSFSEAVDFVGKLDDSRTAFGGILGDFQQGNSILDEATKRTRAFGITEQQTTQAFRDLAPEIAKSTASVDQQAEALARFAVIHPEDPVAALKTAVEGLASGGRITQITKDLSLTSGEQARLKQGAAENKDVFVLLNDVLDQHGITLDVAAKRMDGLAGATKREQIAAEDLEKAMGRFAAGPGVVLTNLKTTGIDTFTADLQGRFNDIASANQLFAQTLINTGSATEALAARSKFLSDAYETQQTTADALGGTIARLKDDTYDAAAASQAHFAITNRVGSAFEDERRAAAQLPPIFSQLANARYQDSSAIASQNEAIAEQQAKQQVAILGAQDAAKAQELLASLGSDVAQGFTTSGNAALIYAQRLGIAYGEALTLINAQSQIAQQSLNTQALADQRAGERGGLTDSQLKTRNADTKLQQTYTNNLRDSEIALAAAKKDTGRQIDLLRQKQAQFAKGTADYNTIEAQIIGIQQSGGKARVSAAQTTALQLNNVEENSGLQLLKTQRENQERLADAAADFNLKKARSQEDEDRKIQDLLAHGQRAAATKERADFARQQQRDQEDFTIQRQRTLRNNAEATGDIGTRTDLRTSQIDQRAALRGVRPAGAATLPNAPGPVPAIPAPAQQPTTLHIQIAPTQVQIDAQTIVTITWPLLEQRFDTELANELGTIGITLPPGGGQTAVSGARP